jgi:hypothetical protein
LQLKSVISRNYNFGFRRALSAIALEFEKKILPAGGKILLIVIGDYTVDG